MSLSQPNQRKTIRFGGSLNSNITNRDENFDPEKYLNSLSETHFKFRFYEWLAQCWIYNNTENVPITDIQLAKFNVDSLIPEFRLKYILGDWKLFTENSGATIDEMILCWQMSSKEPILLILNKDQKPPPILPEIANYTFIWGNILSSVYLEFINQKNCSGSKVLISDGITNHVFNGIYFDESRQVLQYEDNIGANGKCFLSKENNAFQIDSKFVGHNNYGGWSWEISREDFDKVVYGFPLNISFLNIWNSVAFKQDVEKYNRENNIDLERDAHTKIMIDK